MLSNKCTWPQACMHATREKVKLNCGSFLCVDVSWHWFGEQKNPNVWGKPEQKPRNAICWQRNKLHFYSHDQKARKLLCTRLRLSQHRFSPWQLIFKAVKLSIISSRGICHPVSSVPDCWNSNQLFQEIWFSIVTFVVMVKKAPFRFSTHQRKTHDNLWVKFHTHSKVLHDIRKVIDRLFSYIYLVMFTGSNWVDFISIAIFLLFVFWKGKGKLLSLSQVAFYWNFTLQLDSFKDSIGIEK